MDLKFSDQQSSTVYRPTLELVVQIRDAMGVPTGRTKSFITDSPEQLDNFWQRNGGKPIKKKKRKTAKKKEFIPTAKEAEGILKEVSSYNMDVLNRRMEKLDATVKKNRDRNAANELEENK